MGSKGLESLLKTAKEKSGAVAKLQEIPVALLFPIENQDRKHFDPAKLEELASSMRERIAQGKLPNVEPLSVYQENDSRYLIEGGERRWRAAKLLNYDGPMLCLVSYSTDENELSDIMFLSNFGREDLNPIDLSNALGDRIDSGNWDRQKAMAMTGLSKSSLSKILRLRELPLDVQQLCIDGVRTDREFLIDLARLPDEGRQEYIQKIRDGSFNSQDQEILKNKLSEVPTASGNKKAAGSGTRKPTKLSLKAAQLRQIAGNSTPIRKAIKAQCKSRFKHANLSLVTDGEFVDMFAASISDWPELGIDEDTSD